MATSIPQSKAKLYLLLPGIVIMALVSLFIVLAGLGMLFPDATIHSAVVVLFALIFCTTVYFTILLIRKAADKTPGITVTGEGFTELGSGIGKQLGLIRWKDVKELKVDDFSERFLTVIVHNPNEYLVRIKNGIALKHVRRHEEKHRGAILNISAYGLDCRFDELKTTLLRGLKEFRENTAESQHV